MIGGPSLTARADATRDIPPGAASRLDRIDGALASLAEESRRLERLGFERPLARLEAQRRYWLFLRGLFTVASGSDASRFAKGAR